MGYLLPVLLLILMYALLIRPQQQRVRRQRALVQSLDVGDRVVSIGGIVGEIVALSDEMIEVEVTEGVVITFLRGAISRKLDTPPIDITGDDEADADDDDPDDGSLGADPLDDDATDDEHRNHQLPEVDG